MRAVPSATAEYAGKARSLWWLYLTIHVLKGYNRARDLARRRPRTWCRPCFFKLFQVKLSCSRESCEALLAEVLQKQPAEPYHFMLERLKSSKAGRSSLF